MRLRVYFEAASTSNERLRADEHHQQDEEQCDPGWISATTDQAKQTGPGREEPFGGGEVLCVDHRIVDDDRCC